MKKPISLILLVALILMLASCGKEEFKLHSDVKFGMTREKVISAEKAAGFDVEENNQVVVKGTIATIEDSSITYIFDKDGKLDSAIYRMPDYSKSGQFSDYLLPDQMSACFQSISDMLVEKYGVPECGNVAGKYYKLALVDKSRSTYMEKIGDYAGKKGMGEQWLIVQSNGTSVLIENTFYVETFTGSFGNGAHYIPRLFYYYCDKDTTKALQKQINGSDL